MDYNSSLRPAANQAFPFDDMLMQHNARMPQPQPQQGHPASFNSNYIPYETLLFDAPFISTTNGFPYPPLPDPHGPASLDAGPPPGQGSGDNNHLGFKGSDVDSTKAGIKRRNVRGTRQGSAATSADEITPSTDREEKEETDPQSRRKAQNRAAQRAFRERKEQRVRGLEDELVLYKEKYSALQRENEDLKRQIAKLSTENEILKATAHASCPNGKHNHDERVENKTPETTSPRRYFPMDQDEISASNAPIWPNKAMVTENATSDAHLPDETQSGSMTPLSQHRIKYDKTTGERYLDASETWEMIVNYRAKHNVMLDLNDVYGRLRGKTKCDGQGAVIGEEVVKKAIQDSVEAGRDDLL